jgi:prepilin-type N-terminal cleavage/methylation domain-containing protein
MRPKRGFTLIELLVVIAIIAILAAILFPVFARMKERAKMTMCISNQRQVFFGIRQYQDDNDERYPPPPVPFQRDDGSVWGFPVPQKRLFPYVKNTGVFICPSTQPGQMPPYYVLGVDIATSYQYNWNAVADPSTIQNPVDTWLIAEAWWNQVHIRELTPYNSASKRLRIQVLTMCDGHYNAWHQMSSW